MPIARILDNDHKLLRELAQRTGKRRQQIVHEALDLYNRDQLLGEINAAFARVRTDPRAWERELAERDEWDGTAGDGMVTECQSEPS